MKASCFILVIVWSLFLANPSSGQSDPPYFVKDYKPLVEKSPYKYFFGYNTFNEVYGGVQFPSRSEIKFGAELAYQFTFAQEAKYQDLFIFFPLRNILLSNYASGVRVRACLFRPYRGNTLSIALEYQNLQSTDLYYYESASSFAAQYRFRDHYQNFGVKLSFMDPLDKNETVFFTYSFALIIKTIHRQYSYYEFATSDKQEDLVSWAPQFTIGVRFVLSR